jgi:outer membrane protein assembly factor BamD
MMRFLFKLVFLLLAVLVLSSCGQKSAGLQESAVAPDKALFETGMRFFEKSYFVKARLSFQTLINTYPESDYTSLAFYQIADSYYEEGGTENLLQAESQYRDFIIYYPHDEKADDAQMKIAAINVRLMKPADRDPTYARKAEVELKKFLQDFPDSELAPTAMEFLREVQENRARSVQDVASFYFSRRSYLASESRYKEVLDNYPNYSELDDTIYNLAVSLERLGRIEEAAVYYSRLAEEYPFSPYFARAKDRLILLERPIPEVNEEMAARNLANRRTDSFSLFTPIRSVIDTFTGGQDPYEVAKRRAEERKASENNVDGSGSAPKEEKHSN